MCSNQTKRFYFLYVVEKKCLAYLHAFRCAVASVVLATAKHAAPPPEKRQKYAVRFVAPRAPLLCSVLRGEVRGDGVLDLPGCAVERALR